MTSSAKALQVGAPQAEQSIPGNIPSIRFMFSTIRKAICRLSLSLRMERGFISSTFAICAIFSANSLLLNATLISFSSPFFLLSIFSARSLSFCFATKRFVGQRTPPTQLWSQARISTKPLTSISSSSTFSKNSIAFFIPSTAKHELLKLRDSPVVSPHRTSFPVRLWFIGSAIDFELLSISFTLLYRKSMLMTPVMKDFLPSAGLFTAAIFAAQGVT